MKDELQASSNRHAERLLGRIGELMDVPALVQDAIRREIGYATMDGYRITMQHKNRNGEAENEHRRTSSR